MTQLEEFNPRLSENPSRNLSLLQVQTAKSQHLTLFNNKFDKVSGNYRQRILDKGLRVRGTLFPLTI